MINNDYARKTELLAPAGSLDSFHAAIEAGADAVYLGLNECNARLRAKNFSVKTLSYLAPYARLKKIKLYVTVNTLIKQHELKGILDLLFQLEQIGVDAVIVQDIGLASIIHANFPKLALHASTQMVLHNSQGVQAAAQLGFRRVILSRECTLDEIRSIKNSAAIEIETFIHGALCYSISGLCLASSYLGGLSGNRGRCTQVCRRRFTSEGRSGFFFSPRDLCAVDFIHGLIHIGIDCLKIEGRMKSAEYVYSVVSSYRKIIDNTDLAEQIKAELAYDLGRKKTAFFLPSADQKMIIDACNEPGTGLFLGAVTAVYSDSIEVHTGENPAVGDKIRITATERAEGSVAKIARVLCTGKRCRLFIDNPAAVKLANRIYLISRKTALQKKWSHMHVDTKPVYYKEHCPFSHKILNKYFNQANDRSKHTFLYLRIDSLKWLRQVQSTSCHGIILQCIKEDFHEFKTAATMVRSLAKKIIISLPPFIPEIDIPQWKELIGEIRKTGVRQWMCANIGQKDFFTSNDILFADSTLWCTNLATRDALKKIGFRIFSYSQEDDILNLKATADGNGLMTVFAHIPLFISRIQPALKPGAFAEDDNATGFFIKKQNGLYYLVGDKPLCLTHRIDKLNSAGIHSFVLDFSFRPADKGFIRPILAGYYNKNKVPGSTLFNHKAGLK